MKLKIVAAVLAVVMLSAMSLITVAPTEAAAPATSTATIPISGTNPLGTFTGTLSNLNVVSQNGQLFLNGVLNGSLTNAAGTVLATATNLPVSLPLAASGSCTILHLVLGPIDLNLLGLMVHTNQIVLDITAQSGPGNLLGNLLCTVAHLLDSNASGNALANLLNNILGQLTGILGGL